MAFKDNLKQWFTTGSYPTEAQFAQMFDWLRMQDQQLAIADITGLSDIINNLVAVVQKEKITVGNTGKIIHTIVAGYVLNSISVFPVADGPAFCTSNNGDAGDIVPSSIVLANGGAYWLLSLQVMADTNIIINALPGTDLILITTKIK